MDVTGRIANTMICRRKNAGGITMPQKQPKQNTMQTDVSGTDPQKVKQEIQKDVSQGQGAMTSREAGAIRD